MDPIISPWIIYLISLLSVFKVLAIILVAILSIGSIMSATCYHDSCGKYRRWGSDLDHEESKMNKKLLKGCIVGFIVSLVLAIFIPDRETMTMMLIADNVTPDNIENVKELIVELTNEIRGE